MIVRGSGTDNTMRPRLTINRVAERALRSDAETSDRPWFRLAHPGVAVAIDQQARPRAIAGRHRSRARRIPNLSAARNIIAD